MCFKSIDVSTLKLDDNKESLHMLHNKFRKFQNPKYLELFM